MLNLDLSTSLPLEEVCERPQAGTCEKCGAWIEEPCQLPCGSASRVAAEPREVTRAD
jgi:hypothetical protein